MNTRTISPTHITIGIVAVFAAIALFLGMDITEAAAYPGRFRIG